MQTELVLAEVEAALAQLETIPPVIVLADHSWAPGVLGPVAAKVSEKHLRPAVILAGSEGTLGGSGRSFGDWDLAAAFQEIEGMLLRHGGHARAAGLSIASDRYPELGPALSQLYLAAALPLQVAPEFAIDADLEGNEISLGLVEQLEALGPFGAGNPRPVLRWKAGEGRGMETGRQNRRHGPGRLTGNAWAGAGGHIWRGGKIRGN